LKTSTSVSSTASATPSNCGIYGDFMLTVGCQNLSPMHANPSQ
jgi:hypothetical protein